MGSLFFFFSHCSSGNTLFSRRIQSLDPFLLHLTGWPDLLIHHGPELISTDAHWILSHLSDASHLSASPSCQVCPLKAAPPPTWPFLSSLQTGAGGQCVSSPRGYIPCPFLSQFLRHGFKCFCLPQAHSLTHILGGDDLLFYITEMIGGKLLTLLSASPVF